MKTYNLTLEDGTELTLRLTSTAIAAYVKAHGIPGAALLTDIAAAADDIEKQITLFSKALQHPGNNNKIKDGGRLLDLLADEGKDAAFRRTLIIQLAHDAGICNDAEAAELERSAAAGGAILVSSIAAVLARTNAGGEDAEALDTKADASGQKNPT